MTTAPYAVRYGAEFFGTFLFVLSIGCIVLGGNAVWSAAAVATALGVLVYTFAPVSGAHLNPAVTLALTVLGRVEGGWKAAIGYVGAQLLGGILAGFCSAALYGHGFKLGPGQHYVWAQAMVVEVLYTLLLCFVVLSVTTKWGEEKTRFYGVAIGMVITAGGYPSAAISGGCFNPAVAFGIDLPHAVFEGAWMQFGWSFAYTGMHIVGALLAALLFWLVMGEMSKKSDEEVPLGNPDVSAEPAPLRVRLVCEGLGTMFLTMTIGLNVLTGSPAPGLSIATMLAVLVYAAGPISGAHLNPAVTVALMLCGTKKNAMGLREAGCYVLAQLCGAIFGAVIYLVTLRMAFSLEPSPRYGWGAAAVGEMIFTMVLCLVVLTVAADDSTVGDATGIAVGGCVLLGGTAIGAISGAPLNPAVAFGIGFADIFNAGPSATPFAYSCFELVGATLAAAAFRLFHSDFSKIES